MTTRDLEPAVLDIRRPLAWSAVILLGMLAATIWAWSALPADARVAVHWDLQGNPDGFASKAEALLVMPMVAAFTTALMAVLPRLDPRRGNLARSRKLYVSAWLGSLLVSAAGHAAIVATSVGRAVPVTAIAIPATGLLLAVLGNVLGKSRPNFVAGIRTPWTLSSDDSWEKTHRWTGRLLVVTGLGSVLVSLAAGPGPGIAVLLVGTFVSLAAGVVLSYVFWRRDPERFAHDRTPGDGA